MQGYFLDPTVELQWDEHHGYSPDQLALRLEDDFPKIESHFVFLLRGTDRLLGGGKTGARILVHDIDIAADVIGIIQVDLGIHEGVLVGAAHVKPTGGIGDSAAEGLGAGLPRADQVVQPGLGREWIFDDKLSQLVEMSVLGHISPGWLANLFCPNLGFYLMYFKPFCLIPVYARMPGQMAEQYTHLADRCLDLTRANRAGNSPPVWWK